MKNSLYIIAVIMNLIKHFWAMDASLYYLISQICFGPQGEYLSPQCLTKKKETESAV